MIGRSQSSGGEIQQRAQPVFGGADVGDGGDEVLFAGRDLHARLEDVERRGGADVDADLGDAGLVAGQEERFLDHVDEAAGVDQIVVGLFDGRGAVEQHAAEDLAVDAEGVAGDGDAAAGDVDAEVAQPAAA